MAAGVAAQGGELGFGFLRYVQGVSFDNRQGA
jgi:hypothetical protein